LFLICKCALQPHTDKRLGPLGYIGGTVLDRLLSHPSAVFWSFTALVRSKEKAAKLKEAGVTAIIADLTDSDLIEKAASEADVAFTMVLFLYFVLSAAPNTSYACDRLPVGIWRARQLC